MVNSAGVRAARDWYLDRLAQAPGPVVPVVVNRLRQCHARLGAIDVQTRLVCAGNDPRCALRETLAAIPGPRGVTATVGGRNRIQLTSGEGGILAAVTLRADIGMGSGAHSLADVVGRAREVILGLSCFGGDAAEASRMHDLLWKHPSVTTVAVDWCCSAAVDVLLAGRRRLMHREARLMVHSPQLFVMGSAGQLRAAADASEAALGPMAEFLQRRTGQSATVVEGWLDGRDHYFSADQALAVGLVDEIFEDFKSYPQALVAPEGYGS